MSQQYSLRWNNHQPNFISMFGTLLATKNLVDVTLAAEGQHLAAHKVVLSACSTYFHSLFMDNPSSHPIVILKDIKINDLKTMVDFMYYGEVNVTEEQLPQVLETAKVLKIKGLTEMPDSTSLTRSQGSSTDFATTDTSNETGKPLSPKRRKRRISSSGSGVNRDSRTANDNMSSNCGQRLESIQEDVTLSSVPQLKRREPDERMDDAQQSGEPSNLNIDQLSMDNNSLVGMAQDILPNIELRPVKFSKRHSNLKLAETAQRGKKSTAMTSRLAAKAARKPRHIKRSWVTNTLAPVTTATITASTSTSTVVQVQPPQGQAQRARHTPAVRSGPPLSCNYCWNTLDNSGRILRRKTKYQCPECRINLCIVPCFHKYHDNTDNAANANANPTT